MAQLLMAVGNLFMHSDFMRQSETWPKYSLIPSLVTRYSIVKIPEQYFAIALTSYSVQAQILCFIIAQLWFQSDWKGYSGTARAYMNENFSTKCRSILLREMVKFTASLRLH